ncbi:MAG: type transporter [Actinomycetia bacterium]|jgi:ABC-2 type transport system permease protein|nr:type transporter [Actinomycetes bacterium]
MRLALIHAVAQLRQLARYPMFLVPTLALPVGFYALFGLPQSRSDPTVLMASFAAYAILGVAFFQFGVGIAIEREEPWEAYLRTLPASAAVRFAGRLGSALVFAAASVAPVLILAAATRPISLSAVGWLRLAFVLGAGAVPLGLLGIALGYWVPAKGALPVANLLYLGFAYAGGLWTGPRGLPHALATIGPYLPTRQWGDVLWSAARGGGVGGRHWLALFGFSVAFAVAAAAGYRRDEGRRFR